MYWAVSQPEPCIRHEAIGAATHLKTHSLTKIYLDAQQQHSKTPLRALLDTAQSDRAYH